MSLLKVDHDLHLHSTLSSCCHDDRMTPERIADAAASLGITEVCLTDHLWDDAVPGASNWYAPQNIAHVRQNEQAARALGLRFGCETEYCGGDKLGLAPEHFELFDFVVIPLNHMHMEGFVRPAGLRGAPAMAELIVMRLEQLTRLPIPFEKVGIAHLTTGLMFREGDVDDVLCLLDEARLLRVFDFFAKRGAGIELNVGSFLRWRARPEDRLRVYRLAKKAGCLFYCASDAHQLDHLDVPKVLPDVIEALDIRDGERYLIR